MTSEFQLGRWRVAPSLNRLQAGDTTVHLEPKVMQVLVRLAARSGQVVSKEHLIAEVWADTFVTDDVLKRSISELRKALGDDARQPTYIETIPKGGYRLVAPVVTDTSSEPQQVPGPRQATVGPSVEDGITRSPQAAALSANLALDSPTALLPIGPGGIHDFQRRGAASRVSRAVDLAHAARGERSGNLVGSESGARTQRHLSAKDTAAAGGTLFLHEIADVGLDVQPTLSRFLEYGDPSAGRAPGDQGGRSHHCSD